MARSPSIETQLKTAKRELRDMMRERDSWRSLSRSWQVKARHFEKERNEWRDRFDVLLSKFNASDGASDDDSTT